MHITQTTPRFTLHELLSDWHYADGHAKAALTRLLEHLAGQDQVFTTPAPFEDDDL